MNPIKYYLLILGLLLFNYSIAQNYQAINGSQFAGSLAPSSNPASIVQVPYAWDITPFAVQIKQSTNAFKINKYSFLSSPKNIEIKAENGIKKRFVFSNQDIRLLNARFTLNSTSAIAFGASIRSYAYARASNSNWQDTAYSLADYLKINLDKVPLSADAAASNWAELYASYARTIYREGNKILNAGITINYNRAISGGYGIAENVNYVQTATTKLGYLLTTGSLQYGYSANFDKIDSIKTSTANRKLFLQNNNYNLGADIGFEYIIGTEQDINLDNDQIDEYAYDTKIGISLMDLGSNKYSFGSRSITASGVLPGITDTLLENKFNKVTTLDNFNDSIASIAASFKQMSGDFYIYKPTRLVINVDQHIAANFFINAEVTLPLLPIISNNSLFIRDMNFIAITPRWETKRFGAYFPILFNNRQQLWVGGAFKAGPLLLGTHNLANLFSKNTTQSGGLYLAFTIRPGEKYDRQAHNSNNKISSKTKRSVSCPKF